MNRLERIQLLERVTAAESKAAEVSSQYEELSARIAALESGSNGRPQGQATLSLKGKDARTNGDGQGRTPT